MTDKPADQPKSGSRPTSEAERREARRAAALRENLRRRKARERAEALPREKKAPA